MPHISDRELAALCVASYDGHAETYPWDVRIDVSGVKVFVKRYPDLDAVVFPGTEDVTGWLRDFFAVPLDGHSTVNHERLGLLHAGFALGMDEAAQAVRAALRPEVEYWVSGHSLGAARGWIFVGEMVGDRVPDGVCMFASPHPGFPRLAEVIDAADIPYIASYWNRLSDVDFDVVPTLAPFVPVFFPWTTPGPSPTVIAVPTPPGDNGVFPLHRIASYESGASG